MKHQKRAPGSSEYILASHCVGYLWYRRVCTDSPVTLAYFSLSLLLADQIYLIFYLLNTSNVHKGE